MFELIPIDRALRRAGNFDPFRDFDELERRFFGSPNAVVNSFRTDVMDNGDAYVLEAELPGFTKENINIDIENDCLTITAERKNRDPFSFRSTARFLFSCNEMPRNYGDRSEGFYRRLIIIPFEQRFRGTQVRDSTQHICVCWG